MLQKIIINENDLDVKIYYNAVNKDRLKVIPWWRWKVFFNCLVVILNSSMTNQLNNFMFFWFANQFFLFFKLKKKIES